LVKSGFQYGPNELFVPKGIRTLDLMVMRPKSKAFTT